MSHTITVRCRGDRENVPSEVVGSLSEADWALFGDFVQFAHELALTEIVSGSVGMSVKMRWSPEAGLQQSASMPTADQLAAFLHRLRPFILSKEPTYYSRVSNILKRQVRHDGWHEFLKQGADLFSGREFGREVRISTGPLPPGTTVTSDAAAWADLTQVNSENTLGLWLNAYEYHRDPAKRAELEARCGPNQVEMLMPIFMSMMYDKANAVRGLAELLRHVLAGHPVYLDKIESEVHP